jgi:uncharacterized RDD family membrane protein YckC
MTDITTYSIINRTPDLDTWRTFEGVRTKRILAFLVDFAFVLLLCIPAIVVVFFIGLFTFGLGWVLYSFLFFLVAIPYIGFTLGGANQATPGMKIMNIHMIRLDGTPVDPMLAIAHGVLFWIGNTFLTPLIMLISLFSNRKRLLHDMLLGVVVVRSDSF